MFVYEYWLFNCVFFVYYLLFVGQVVQVDVVLEFKVGFVVVEVIVVGDQFVIIEDVVVYGVWLVVEVFFQVVVEFVVGYGLVVVEDGVEVVDGYVFYYGVGGFYVGDCLIYYCQYVVVGVEKIMDYVDVCVVQIVGVEEFGVGFWYVGNLFIFFFVVDQVGVDFKVDLLVVGW